VSGGRAARPAMRCLAGGTISCFMVIAAAMRANLVVFTVSPDMTILLTVIATDWLTDILQDRDCVTFNKDFLAYKVIGSLRVGAGDFHGNYLLVWSVSVGSLEPLC
jgi:hypothetical protein